MSNESRAAALWAKKRPPEGGLYTASTVSQHTQKQDDTAEENAGAHFGATGFILVLAADGGDQLGGEDKGQYGHNDNGGIADAVGFKSSVYFSQAFKTYVGISPKDYRQKKRKKK